MVRTLIVLLCCVSALLRVCPAVEKIKVLFTPTICRLRCNNGGCTNYCERGNVTTVYSNGERAHTHPSGFRMFLCPLLCKNGGMCIQKDRCICPPNFTGKFCHIPVSSSTTNNVEKPTTGTNVSANQGLMQSEYILPLQSPLQNHSDGSPMVMVRVHHPPEASVKIHQVLKVTSGSSSEIGTQSSGHSGAHGNGAHGDMLLSDRAEAPPHRILAQTIRGDSVYTEMSGFKYCFREVRNGQCSSPMPGILSQEACCRGNGAAWGLRECTLCPSTAGSCPKGFERVNGTQCVDINECVEPGFCENGKCVNTRGSYSCVCKEGFLLDASRGLCISQKVISEEKDQCFRVVTQGSCSLPILKNITKQICCCSRVGKAWGHKCEACPYFGSAEFKEICPAGPGYHYSPNTIKLHHRLIDPNHLPPAPGANRTSTTVSRHEPSVSQSTTRHQPPNNPIPARPQTPTINHYIRIHQTNTIQRQPYTSNVLITKTEPLPNPARPTKQAIRELPSVIRTQTSRPSINRQPVPPIRPAPVPATARPLPPRRDKRVCETDPQICGSGRCVDVAGGKHTCVCDPGFIFNSHAGRCQDKNECVLTPRPCLYGQCENTEGSFRCVCPSGYQSNSQQTQCSDIDECRQIPNPCSNGLCENTQGSFRCVCRTGFKLQNNTCTDVDECDDPLLCPGKECVNSQGSYRCVSCKPGFGLLNDQCSDIDECRQRPSPCSSGHCENTPGSYRCVCNTGYKLQGNTCTDVNECEVPLQCPGQECINTQGSYRCASCGPGYALTSGRCTDIDECRRTLSPCSDGQCENTQGSYRCVCRTGYRLQGNTCTDVDECENPLQCRGQACVNTPGSYRCSACESGYSFRNGQCTDVDECSQNSRLCANGRCENTAGSFRCVCRPGFRLEEDTCTDVDECSQNSRLCANGRCENTAGSFRCVCRPGFRLKENTCTDVDECENQLQCPGQKCVNSVGSFKCVSCEPGFQIVNGQCRDVDECTQTPPPCSNGRCENTPGSYKCACRAGFKLQGNTCTDVDECQSSGTCGLKSVCVNTAGSYRCECSPGFRTTGPGRQCRDINECLEGELCFTKGECMNTEGSYVCVCAQGYRASANATICTDIDECARGGVCEDGHCTNTDGSFVCHCKSGFTANPEKTACLDVDECADSGGSVCGSQRCENTIGSFRCLITCDPGYSITPTGECVDINECANATACGNHMFCRNLIGTYQCICDQGYELARDGRSCVDTNECVVMAGVCGAARCWNVEGSFMCECEKAQEEFNPVTRQCVNTASSSSSPPQPGEKRECYLSVSQTEGCKVLSFNVTVQECCCTVGRAWGVQCKHTPCPQPGTSEFQAMCPSGSGYVTSALGAFSYRDVDECKLFDPEVCKGGVCVNIIPGFSCYCPTGFYYDRNTLQCVDNNECESEDVCPGGLCVNTFGSYHCTCQEPLVLDDTQQHCINSSFTVDENLSYCWQDVTAELVCQRPLLGIQFTFVDCCCLYGKAWGLHCALCPRRDEEVYEAMCSALGPPPGSPRYFERFGASSVPGGDYRPPYDPPVYHEFPLPDYEDYSAGTGSSSGLRTPPYSPYVPPAIGRSSPYYQEEDYDSPALSQFAPDPRRGRSRSSGRRSRPGSFPEAPEKETESWTGLAPFPRVTDRRTERPLGGYERRYVPYAGLSGDECGILQGCENGRCVRVFEGYTCDCFDGYQFDIGSMTCTDVDECKEPTFPECINARCVNTDGSYRCVCLRGFVMSRGSNYCIPA